MKKPKLKRPPVPVETERRDAPRDSKAPPAEPPAGPSLLARVDEWLAARSDWFVLAMMVAGLALRIRNAGIAYLSGDEALHYGLANHDSVFSVVSAGMSNAHPPLFYILLHYWLKIGDSELWLRMLPALAGTAALWFLYRWTKLTLGPAAALAATGMMAFSPSLICQVTEVRNYGLLMLTLTASLYCLEQAIRRNSERWMAAFAVCLLLAIYTHYTAAWFVLCLGLFVPARAARREIQWPVLKVWAVTQAAGVASYVLLYFVHVRKITGSDMTVNAIEGWLKPSYPRLGETSWNFWLDRTQRVFAYHASANDLGLIALALYLLGLVWIVTRRKGWVYLLVIALPILVCALAAIWKLTPYGGTRHTAVLAPELAIGAGAGIAGIFTLALRRWTAQPVLAVLLLIVIAAVEWPDYADHRAYDYVSPGQDKKVWANAVKSIHEHIPPGSLLFTDHITLSALGYYLRNDRATPAAALDPAMPEFSYGGYRVVMADKWQFMPEDLQFHLQRFREQYHVDVNQPVWVIGSGQGAEALRLIMLSRLAFRNAPHWDAGVVTFLQAPGGADAFR